MGTVGNLIAATALAEAARIRQDYEERLAAANRIIADQCAALSAAYDALHRAADAEIYNQIIAREYLMQAIETLRHGCRKGKLQEVVDERSR